VSVTLPLASMLIDLQQPEPISDRAKSYWRPQWPSKAHKPFCACAACRAHSRNFDWKEGVPNAPKRNVDDLVNVFDAAQQRGDEFADNRRDVIVT
jgi:hypothetical protein